MTKYHLHMADGNSTEINADDDSEALCAAEEVAEELGDPCVEVYRLGSLGLGADGRFFETLLYVGSRP